MLRSLWYTPFIEDIVLTMRQFLYWRTRLVIDITLLVCIISNYEEDTNYCNLNLEFTTCG